MSSRAIYNLVRALTKPYVGAHIVWNDKEYKIWEVIERINDEINIEPGKVIEVNNNIVIKTSDGSVELKKHELDLLPLVGEYF